MINANEKRFPGTVACHLTGSNSDDKNNKNKFFHCFSLFFCIDNIIDLPKTNKNIRLRSVTAEFNYISGDF